MANLNIPTNDAHLGGVTWVKITIPLTIITIGFVALRIWWRYKQLRKIKPSDVAVILAMVWSLTKEDLHTLMGLTIGDGHCARSNRVHWYG